MWNVIILSIEADHSSPATDHLATPASHSANISLISLASAVGRLIRSVLAVISLYDTRSLTGAADRPLRAVVRLQWPLITDHPMGQSAFPQ